MAKRFEIYKCEHCGNIVEVLHGGAGALICCGEEMKLMEAKTADTSTEKHVPFIEATDKGVKVRVGENTEHPMMENHYIEWISVSTKAGIMRQFLAPDQKPEAEFFVEESEVIKANEYCNLHGLWKFEK